MFDAKQFIRQNFQNPAGVVAHFNSAGLTPPTEAQVEKWISRNSLTGDWLAKLLVLLEVERAAPVSLQPYMGAAA